MGHVLKCWKGHSTLKYLSCRPFFFVGISSRLTGDNKLLWRGWHEPRQMVDSWALLVSRWNLIARLDWHYLQIIAFIDEHFRAFVLWRWSSCKADWMNDASSWDFRLSCILSGRLRGLDSAHFVLQRILTKLKLKLYAFYYPFPIGKTELLLHKLFESLKSFL